MYTVDADEDGNYIVDYAGENTTFGVVSVTPVGYDEALPTTDYTVKYYSDEQCTAEVTEFEAGMDYYIAIATAGDAIDNFGKQTHVEKFTIGKKPTSSLEGAQIYVVNPDDPSDVSQTTVTYTGKQFTFSKAWGDDQLGAGNYTLLGLAKDGKALKLDDDYKADSPTQPTIINAGTYTIQFKGVDEFSGTYNKTLTVEKLDLTKVKVTANDLEYTGKELAAELTVEGLAAKAVENELTTTVTGFTAPDTTGDAPQYILDKGTYEATVEPTKAGAANITGSADVAFDVVGELVTNFAYNDVAFSDTALVFNNADDEAFDPKKITVTTEGDTELEQGEDYTVTVTKDGKEVTDYEAAGTYVVTVKVKVDSEYSLGGTATQEFKVIDGKIESEASVFVLVDGKNVPASESEGTHVTYNGEAHNVVVVVKDSEGKNLEQGVDYKVKVVNDKGVESEVVEPGDYTVTIEDGNYVVNLTDQFKITVDKIQIAAFQAVQQAYGDVVAIPYTGEAVAPAVQYTTGETDADGNLVWADFDASLYTLKYYKAELGEPGFDNETSEIIVNYIKGEEVAAEDVVETGKYIAEVTLTEEAGEYYENAVDNDFMFEIVDEVLFQDVKASDWFAPYVAQANKLQYMKGIDGTNLFLPNNAITRAEIAQVIYNMAGAKPESSLPPTDFDDVADDEWYVKAIAFVNAAEIMTGYDDNDSFGVNDNATREQIATTMYRYAKVVGIDTTVEDEAAVLAKYADGAQVSDWAKTAVAWAVENGIMGVDIDVLNPQGDVLRAEVAAIATRVQPEQL